ncbi:hypothetical protein JOF48_001889 [Arthrobacter stackebrandtii]|uniref:Uncharacterized protein n=1 Tax=Arthrobacter stackebrandtii TaxID=272161 RepID=A0ABS4YX65_9MICC|nr:peptidase M56 family protein [Arthrobacter stackebrandtii]MBP2413090.1 hypothetical protein [Arthrobacter stackebrandtii]PYH01140.1 peptidase M56 family protein [Arthrobacter stackebrandtii]
MNEPHLDEMFSTALRKILVAQVDTSVPVKKRKHRRLWIGAGVFAGAGLLGGIGAAAAGILVLPGGDTVTKVASPVTGTYTGTATVDLGPVPDGVTNMAVEFTCLTPGRFVYDDGASVVCDGADIGTRSAVSRYSIPLTTGQHTVTITTDSAARWTLTATYVNQTTTDWATNEQGQSYGVENSKGSPDLVAVMATNGKTGYAFRAALDEADGSNAAKTFKSPDDAIAWQKARHGKTFPIPVYESDGTTLVGEFVIGGQ